MIRNLVLSGLLLLSLAGCVRSNRVLVEQPFAPQSQKSMTLTSRWGWHAAREGRQVLLFEFPLPAAVRGFRAFRVYAEVPSGFGQYSIDPADPRGARAFFVQEVGDLQGKVVIRSGQIEVQPVQFNERQRRVILDLSADHDFRITGDLRAVRDPIEVERFLRDFRADVQALRGTGDPKTTASTQPVAREPADTPPATAPPAQGKDKDKDSVETDAFLFEQE